MPMTMSEKILARCANRTDARAGEIVMAAVDCAMMDDILGPRVLDEPLQRLGGRICRPERAVVVCDHYTPAATHDQADIVKYTRDWVVSHGLTNYFEGEGPCHQVLAENGFSLPGTLQVGTDSHTCTAGAFGCFGTGVGSTEMAGVLATGELWLRVPETLLFHWSGMLPQGVMAKDMILKMIGLVGHAGATYCTMEFAGPTIEALPMDERMCISNMAVEAGAKAGLIAADNVTRAYLIEHDCSRGYHPLNSDPDAVYRSRYAFDASALEPQVACPHQVDAVMSVRETAGAHVDQVYIGSCTGGRLTDLRAAAKVLRGHRIAPSCRLLVSPASRRIWMEAEREGVLRTLAEAGATILAPTCGACLGVHSGLLAGGETCVSTTNRNFKGRMGSERSAVYLSSPLTAAATALRGVLTDPRDVLPGKL